ncbi:MAG: calcium-binding protein [Planctomycetota bacterium]
MNAGFNASRLAAALLASMLPGALANAQTTPLPPLVTTRISVDSAGGQGNGESDLWANGQVSADGRFIVFDSTAPNLVPGDTNGVGDIFVHDRMTGETTRVSVNSSGKQGNGWSGFSSISANGRYVAFTSEATNLVPSDSNHVNDVFVHDRVTGETTRASVDSFGNQGDDSVGRCLLSADGRFVAFTSSATNLVLGDTNGKDDAFVHDRVTGETTRVSVDSFGNQGNGDTWLPAISADGRYVAFDSYATNLVPGDTNKADDVFVHDRVTGETTRVSVTSSGDQVTDVGGMFPSLSAEGRFVAFMSASRQLVPNDTNWAEDIFVHDRVTGETTRVSVDSQAREGERDSEWESISADGRYVAFASWSNNLAWNDKDPGRDVFVHDRKTGLTTLVSPRIDASAAWPSGSGWPSISADGRYVAFDGHEANLVPDDTNQSGDVLVRGPELTLEADPTVITGGQLLTLTTYKSVPGNPASLWIVGVNGSPVSLLVSEGFFDGDGLFVLSGAVPPGLGPLAITFRSYGTGASGLENRTNDIAVSFQ